MMSDSIHSENTEEVSIVGAQGDTGSSGERQAWSRHLIGRAQGSKSDGSVRLWP